MAFGLKLFCFACVVYAAAAQPVEEEHKEGPKEDRKHVTIAWKSTAQPITLAYKEANPQSSDPSEKKGHVTVSWKEAQATRASEVTQDRKGFTVSWRGAKLEQPVQQAEAQDRKHFTVSWKSASADEPQGKRQVTFTLRQAPGANYSSEVGPDGHVHYPFVIQKADGSETRAWWSFIPSLFGAFAGGRRDAPVEGSPAAHAHHEVKKHQISFGWRDSVSEPIITTDPGSKVVISQEPVLYTTQAPAS